MYIMMCVHQIMKMYIHGMYMLQTCMYRFAHSCGGVRIPRQLLLGHSFELVPESMSRNPAWLQPLRRALKGVEVRTLFPYLDRGEGVPEVAVHHALLSEVIRGLRGGESPTEPLFEDQRWERVESDR